MHKKLIFIVLTIVIMTTLVSCSKSLKPGMYECNSTEGNSGYIFYFIVNEDGKSYETDKVVDLGMLVFYQNFKYGGTYPIDDGSLLLYDFVVDEKTGERAISFKGNTNENKDRVEGVFEIQTEEDSNSYFRITMICKLMPED